MSMANKEEKRVNENLRYYDELRKVPKEALKTIAAGRLKGMSDINPMWRIQAMTDTFGPCGIGWKYEIVKQWNEAYGQEIATFCNVNLYIKVDNAWSDPIPGTGGSTFVAVESRGPRMSDECFKMALTDALSVAMKALGVAADVYYAKGVTTFDTKYERQSFAAQTKEADNTELNDAFMLIKANIENAPSRAYLMDLRNQNLELADYQPFRDAMNKRYKEVS